jgi:hypothetical protein
MERRSHRRVLDSTLTAGEIQTVVGFARAAIILVDGAASFGQLAVPIVELRSWQIDEHFQTRSNPKPPTAVCAVDCPTPVSRTQIDPVFRSENYLPAQPDWSSLRPGGLWQFRPMLLGSSPISHRRVHHHHNCSEEETSAKPRFCRPRRETAKLMRTHG